MDKNKKIYDLVDTLIKEAEEKGDMVEAEELREKAFNYYGFDFYSKSIEWENSGASDTNER